MEGNAHVPGASMTEVIREVRRHDDAIGLAQDLASSCVCVYVAWRGARDQERRRRR